jgi:hypothetical protein
MTKYLLSYYKTRNAIKKQFILVEAKNKKEALKKLWLRHKDVWSITIKKLK